MMCRDRRRTLIASHQSGPDQAVFQHRPPEGVRVPHRALLLEPRAGSLERLRDGHPARVVPVREGREGTGTVRTRASAATGVVPSEARAASRAVRSEAKPSHSSPLPVVRRADA